MIFYHMGGLGFRKKYFFVVARNSGMFDSFNSNCYSEPMCPSLIGLLTNMIGGSVKSDVYF